MKVFMIQTYRFEKGKLVNGIYLVIHSKEILDAKTCIFADEYVDLKIRQEKSWFTVKKDDLMMAWDIKKLA